MQSDTAMASQSQPPDGLVSRLSAAERWIGGGTRLVASAGVVLMLASALFLAADVVVFRYMLGAPLPASNEIFRMVFSVAIAATLASGLASDATLKVDVLHDLMPPKVQRMLETIGVAIYLIILAALAWGVMEHTLSAWEAGNLTTILRLQVWPFYAFISVLLLLTIPAQCLVVMRSISEQSAGSAVLGLILGGSIAAASAWAIASAQPWILAHPVGAAGIAFVVLWLAILLCLPVAAALLGVAGIGIAGMFGMNVAVTLVASEMTGLLTNGDLAIIPLFLMMGGFAVASGMSADVYRLAQAVFSPFRGGLAMATIGGCAGFGALTGSSVATVATIGATAYPEMSRRGYPDCAG